MTPWMDTATSLMGTKEVAGNGDNPTIIAWAHELGGWVSSFYNHDAIPWCGLFVGLCIHRCGMPIPSNALGAKNWATWGVPIEHPCFGAVLVFQRPGGGHVGFYIGENATAYRVRGGNQSDSVDDTWVEKSRCIAMRWPSGVEVEGAPILLTSSGVLSHNEA